MTTKDWACEMDMQGMRTMRRAQRRAMVLALPLRLVLASGAFIIVGVSARKLAPALKGARAWWNLGRR